MRANLFFFLCAGFVGAVVLLSLVSVKVWMLALLCVCACVFATLLERERRLYVFALLAGCLAAAARIALLPDAFPAFIPAFSDLMRAWSQSFGSVFAILYPEPIASFAQGILTGAAGMRLDPAFMQALRTTSTLHLIAVSGYNVTLVASGAYKLLHWTTVPRKVIWIVVLFLLAAFTVFVGAPASAVRASIMASLVVIAERFYRSGNARNALAFAATAMLLWQPSVIFDLGFQLSFLATTGIMVLAPLFVRAERTCPDEDGGWKHMAIETLCAQALVMPVLVFKSGTVSFLGLAANFVVLPLIPAAMAVSFAAGMGFLLWNVLGRTIAFVSMPFFLFITHAIAWFSSLPLASVHVSEIPVIWVIAYYACIALFVRSKMKNAHA